MSCELVIGINTKHEIDLNAVITGRRFIHVKTKLNGYPFTTDELVKLLELRVPHSWFVSLETDIAYKLPDAIHGGLGDVLRECKQLRADCVVLFSDSGTNEFKIIRSLSLENAADEVLGRFGSGPPPNSCALIFEK